MGHRAGAILLLAVVIGTTAWGAPGAFHDAARVISTWEGATPQARELAPAQYVGIPARALLAARALIPARSIYHVERGTPKPGLTWTAYRELSFYWLFPRRYTNDATRADWILAYENSLKDLPFHYSAVWHIAPGIAVAHIQR